MRRVHDVLRLKLEGRLSDRQIGRSLGIPRTTVRDYVLRFEASGLVWPLSSASDEAALEQVLFKRGEQPPPLTRPLPEWALVA